MANSITLRDNVVFMKTNQITFTRSIWKITITLDFEPYDKFISQISEDADRVNRIVKQSVTKYEAHASNNPNFHSKIISLEQDLSRLKYTYLELRAKFSNNKFMRTK